MPRKTDYEKVSNGGVRALLKAVISVANHVVEAQAINLRKIVRLIVVGD